MSVGLLDGKRILVTGVADRGSIAHATAARAKRMGARVVVTAMPRDLEGARAAVAAIGEDLSDLARAVTGEILQVDGRHHAVA